MRKHSRPRQDRPLPLTFGTLTTIENAHNTADTNEVLRVSSREDRSDVQGQTRQHSKVINLQRKKQKSICVNKTDCDTAYSKQ